MHSSYDGLNAHHRLVVVLIALVISGATPVLAAVSTAPAGVNSLVVPSPLQAAPVSNQPTSTTSTGVYPTLSDYWKGTADWALETPETGLPVGESDTVYIGNGIYWSYLHASTQSAGIKDSCGGDVEFPGCVTRWVSTDGGHHFDLSEKKCLLKCNSCPCGEEDLTRQQQYPRVTRTALGKFYMVFEHDAGLYRVSSYDGINWANLRWIEGTGVWKLTDGPCTTEKKINPHPFFTDENQCMAGGPPGIIIDNQTMYVFLGLGQNPGHMGCMMASIWNTYKFYPCTTSPLFSGSPEYGPTGLTGAAANPYFDFRFVTSADVILQDGYFYMAYEGVRGPSSPEVGRDNQFGLGFARSQIINAKWEKYPGNPVLGGLMDNWGVGHADLIVVDGVTYMYTATPALIRARYVLVWK